MLKRFFITVLGTITGLWISFGLMFLSLIMFGVVAAIKGENTTDIEKHSILYLNLEGMMSDRQVPADVFEELLDRAQTTIPVDQTIAAIRSAADDSKIDGIFIDAAGSAGGIATRLDICQALDKFKESGKWIVAYGDSYAQGDYFNASVADEIYVNPVGAVDIHGMAVSTYFYKDLLDKLGVKMQIIKVGTYKSAVEPYILSDISEANREQQKLFVDQIWKNVAGTIATNRSTDFVTVNNWADSLIVTEDPASYVGSNVVTALKYRHEVIDLLKEKTDIKKSDELKLVTPVEYCSSTTMPHTSSTDNNIAVLYCLGDIVDTGKEGIVGPEVVKQIQSIIDDEDNDGLVLRVNSGGGSAFASEQIWEALQRYKETGRPFYVSMGDYAASGGYYISCGADRIYAQPVTLTGSIGIFGMIPCIDGLLNDKLGVHESVVATGKNADFISITKPFSGFQMAQMQKMINRGYETFTSRCAQGRNMPVDSIKAIAEGRVWDGETALKIGLVDELGNLNDVIEAMAAELDFGDEYTVTEYPKLKLSFWDRLDELENSQFKSSLITRMLGNDWQMLNSVEKIANMNRVQARMEPITVN